MSDPRLFVETPCIPVSARPVFGGEQSIPETFDPQWEYGAMLGPIRNDTEYAEALTRLHDSARITLPRGTRYQIRADSYRDLDLVLPGLYLSWYYSPWFPQAETWRAVPCPTFDIAQAIVEAYSPSRDDACVFTQVVA